MDFEEALQKGVKGIGIALRPEEEALFCACYGKLKAAAERVNLTGLKDPVDVAVKHFVDAVAVMRWVDFNGGKRLIDVGSGAGFPGIPLGIANPGLQVVLLEAVRKKTEYMREVVEGLHLKNCTVIWGRAEELGRREGYREGFDLVTARAVAPLRILSECTVPFAGVGGAVIAYKGPKAKEEIEESRKAIETLGGVLETQIEYVLPICGEKRLLIIIRKTVNTPDGYPRRAGIPHKKPI
ncbi:MAG: 16S rRNA (guanine(527)-N(7))-methyltransferase RsmG [Bacillota bacterium]